MFDTFIKLNSTDKIQIISIIATTIISITSIVIAILTLRQTNKITQEANRPYISVYYEVVNVTSYVTFLVIKNFGNTGTIIDSVTYSPEFRDQYNSQPFSKLNNHFIAPNQKITTACKFEKPYEPITFNVKYHSGKKYYSESFVINPDAISNVILSKSSSSRGTDLEKIINYSAQEIIRTNL